VFRKISALFFLLVMTMVIGLHSPVFGYCAAEDALLVGSHLIEPVCQHECDHDKAPPAPAPCEEEHEFVTVETADFQWSPLDLIAPPIVLLAEDFISRPVVVVPSRKIFSLDLPKHDPPPPGLPIFRRDGVLRL
jgi:hypothetical protein